MILTSFYATYSKACLISLLYSNKFSYLIMDYDGKKDHGAGRVVEYLGNFRRRNSVPARIIPVFLFVKLS